MKVKEKNTESRKKRDLLYKEEQIQELKPTYSQKLRKQKRKSNHIHKVLKEKQNKTKTLSVKTSTPSPYPQKFNNEGEIKTVSDKQKLREFIISKTTLKEMIKSSSGRRNIMQIRNLDLHKRGQLSKVKNGNNVLLLHTICRSQMYDNCVKDGKAKFAVYFCKIMKKTKRNSLQPCDRQ